MHLCSSVYFALWSPAGKVLTSLLSFVMCNCEFFHSHWYPDFCCHLLTFFQINFFNASFRNTIRVSNGVYPDQDRRFVGTDLRTNCLHRLSAEYKSRRWQEECGKLENNEINIKATKYK